CPHCGESLFSPGELRCAKCGETLESRWKFCPMCGKPQQAVKPPKPEPVKPESNDCTGCIFLKKDWCRQWGKVAGDRCRCVRYKARS
ncbi:MAG: zinc ribbon domain-containing protein, partial [Spirochaetaceae bacterium]|nr:zinc ribbon domain-containing protein [Spirochaetaceae bacterium]